MTLPNYPAHRYAAHVERITARDGPKKPYTPEQLMNCAYHKTGAGHAFEAHHSQELRAAVREYSESHSVTIPPRRRLSWCLVALGIAVSLAFLWWAFYSDLPLLRGGN